MRIKGRDISDERGVREKYLEICPKYEKLAINLKQALELFLEEANIDYLTIDYRIKDVESFIEKIDSQGCKDPFTEIEDICGLRIVCFYKSDVEKICNTVKREFKVLESQDKEELLNINQFGYRSRHFIIKIKKIWSKSPNYRKLADLKVEIQVRTILMYAWAEIEHKLAYKREAHVPNQFKRKLSIMSAKLEDTDEQFEDLREDINEYRQELIDKTNKANGIFDKNLPLNLDNLQAFLDYYFPEKKKEIGNTRKLLDDLLSLNLSMKDIVNSYEKAKNYLPEIEKKIGKVLPLPVYNQYGILRLILCVSNREYLLHVFPDIHENRLTEFLEEWNRKISS